MTDFDSLNRDTGVMKMCLSGVRSASLASRPPDVERRSYPVIAVRQNAYGADATTEKRVDNVRSTPNNADENLTHFRVCPGWSTRGMRVCADGTSTPGSSGSHADEWGTRSRIGCVGHASTFRRRVGVARQRRRLVVTTRLKSPSVPVVLSPARPVNRGLVVQDVPTIHST